MVYEIKSTPDWVLGITIDDVAYEVIWMRITRVEDNYSEHHFGVYLKGSDKALSSQDPFIEPLKEAASAFRIAQLQKELGNKEFFLEKKKSKKVILELAERSFQGDYLGQYSNDNLYLQTVAKVLDIPLADVGKYVGELINEKKIGLTGAILIPYETYAANKQEALVRTGHKDFSSSDMGGWSCNYCGNNAWPEDDVNPLSIPCVKR